MIRYNLTCAEGHEFESWFSSSGDYDRLEKSGVLACAVCGSPRVTKALMAPRVTTSEDAAARPLSAPASPAEQALRALREKLEREAEDVGRDFAREARAIHAGDAPERPIYGEARAEEARALLEDGIPVAPLPWRSRRSD
ncbi:DUF1178 family protein [Halovulum dunhuangense]|uniref:DUF1178 family protein n=1 Tax=Halovulum dunhuangense TaxID=1505036 RepID=A0A849L0F0_9RHOB|nr:DUF1178 family protein [Halovulum dunhuangense]NNU79742.1 DUF1178 family protein [Halovulum dunhuangense]